MGDESALQRLYVIFCNPLFHLALAIIHSRPEAEEVVEDVFIRIWQQRIRLKEVEHLKPYLYVLTRNVSLDYLRKISGRKVYALEDLDLNLPQLMVDSNPEDLMISQEIIRKINLAINELPPRCKLIFRLIKVDGLRHKDVATILNLSVKTVESQMSIALKRLHSSIQLYLPAHSKK